MDIEKHFTVVKTVYCNAIPSKLDSLIVKNKLKHMPRPSDILTIIHVDPSIDNFVSNMQYNFCGEIKKYSTNSKLRRVFIPSHTSLFISLIKLGPQRKWLPRREDRRSFVHIFFIIIFHLI